MIYTLSGLLVAALAGIGVLTIYGADALVTLPWADTMFWSIIGGGMFLNFIDNMISLRLLLCLIIERLYQWKTGVRYTAASELPNLCNCLVERN